LRPARVDRSDRIEHEALVAAVATVRPLRVHAERGVGLGDHGEERPDPAPRQELVDTNAQAADLDVVARLADGRVEEVEHRVTAVAPVSRR
jgi:hypothetical protein